MLRQVIVLVSDFLLYERIANEDSQLKMGAGITLEAWLPTNWTGRFLSEYL